MPDSAPILVLRHELFEHLGHFGAVLKERNVPFLYHDLGEPMGGKDYRAVIVMGGPMSANDPIPGLGDELALIGEALRTGMPILGICLGSQLIAKALGARVYRNEQSEIGWEPVWLTEAGRSDALFADCDSPATFFHWHSDTFDLPAGAEWMAYSEKCRHQAYRYGRRVYGIQFHPEITAEMIADWCSQPVNCGDVATLDSTINSRQTGSEPAARRILERWLDLF